MQITAASKLGGGDIVVLVCGSGKILPTSIHFRHVFLLDHTKCDWHVEKCSGCGPVAAAAAKVKGVTKVLR